MAFTRFHDDPARIAKQLEIETFAGRYQLDRPGPGVNLPYYEDTHHRLQRWGANLHTNTVNLESDLRGLSRSLTRDNIDKNDYKKHAAQTAPMQNYGTAQPYTEESRYSHPAWMYRDLEQSVWEKPLLDPQANLETPFLNNVQTRLRRRDGHITESSSSS